MIMVSVHYISKTANYYIAGLVLSFPGLSLVAYYFMYLEQGVSRVRETIHFALLSAIPFLIFLAALNFTLKNSDLLSSLLVSSMVWLLLSSILIIAWKNFS